MKHITFIVLILGSLTFSCSKKKDITNTDYCIVPIGYFIDRNEQDTVLPANYYDTLTNYTIRITRTFSTPQEEDMLKLAEAIFPPKDMILQEDNGPISDDAVNYTGTLWWFTNFDGVRIPYALTGASVEYYKQLITYFQDGDFTSANTIDMNSAYLVYDADVSYRSSYTLGEKYYKNVYVVNLSLKWGCSCGTLCAQDFRAKRIVVIDNNNMIITVSGDEAIPLTVS